MCACFVLSYWNLQRSRKIPVFRFWSKQHQNCRIFVVVAVAPTPSLSNVNKLIIMHIFQGVSTGFFFFFFFGGGGLLFFVQCLLLLLCFPQCYNVNCSCGAVSLLVTFMQMGLTGLHSAVFSGSLTHHGSFYCSRNTSQCPSLEAPPTVPLSYSSRTAHRGQPLPCL